MNNTERDHKAVAIISQINNAIDNLNDLSTAKYTLHFIWITCENCNLFNCRCWSFEQKQPFIVRYLEKHNEIMERLMYRPISFIADLIVTIWTIIFLAFSFMIVRPSYDVWYWLLTQELFDYSKTFFYEFNYLIFVVLAMSLWKLFILWDRND